MYNKIGTRSVQAHAKRTLVSVRAHTHSERESTYSNASIGINFHLVVDCVLCVLAAAAAATDIDLTQ